MTQTFIAKSVADYGAICEAILSSKTHSIFYLTGDLGAGKTTLVKSFLKTLGSTDEASSPTFSIVNEYILRDQKVYHFDLYRLNDLEEALDIGIEDYLYSGSLCFIEWPEILSDLDLREVHKIQIEHLDNSHRRINFN